ncbi:MAG: hypothetical protein ACH350_03615 [Parachlamydiaceae bacterium]
MKILTALTSCLLIPLSSLFASVSGTYHVHGGNPSEGTSYTGVLVIEKDDEIFHATWQLSDGSSTGIGVKKDDHLAINFLGVDANNEPILGVQLYKIYEHGLEGPWAISGQTTKGVEIAKKEKSSSCR